MDDDLYCSFCGKRRREVQKLVSGPRVFICNECVARSRQILGPRPPRVERSGSPDRTTEDLPAVPPPPEDEEITAERRPPDDRHCSFCGQASSAVTKLISGPMVHICNECIEFCEDIIAANEPGVLV